MITKNWLITAMFFAALLLAGCAQQSTSPPPNFIISEKSITEIKFMNNSIIHGKCYTIDDDGGIDVTEREYSLEEFGDKEIMKRDYETIIYPQVMLVNEFENDSLWVKLRSCHRIKVWGTIHYKIISNNQEFELSQHIEYVDQSGSDLFFESQRLLGDSVRRIVDEWS